MACKIDLNEALQQALRSIPSSSRRASRASTDTTFVAPFDQTIAQAKDEPAES